MDRVVINLYGKLYMGPKRVPHYYVQFKGSEKLEYVEPFAFNQLIENNVQVCALLRSEHQHCSEGCV